MTRARDGAVLALTGLVSRVRAPNPGLMRADGTNTYIIGATELALVDPGPAIDSHVRVLQRVTGKRLRWILCTHTHHDHSPAAAVLKRLTGAQVLGRRAPRDERHDQTFEPDVTLSDGDIVTGADFTIEAIHTPGHTSNHLCFLLNEERVLFSGDHMMGGSTVVISPPDGSMRAYINSLRRLADLDLRLVAPGHGPLITEPNTAIRQLIEHRLKREQKVLAALRAVTQARLDELLPVAYDDVATAFRRAARRSLQAHLIKLEEDGLVRRLRDRTALQSTDDVWMALADEGGIALGSTIGWTAGGDLTKSPLDTAF